MSKKQRRDHKPEPALICSYMPESAACTHCGDRISAVYNRALPVKSRHHWRHWRRA